jgi:competence protein ComEC
MPLEKRIIAVLDVGHGNSTVVKDESGVVIIDAGTKSTLLEFLDEINVTEIDTILISHADEDHIGGIFAILSSGKFKIKKIRLNTDSLKGTVLWDDLLYELSTMSNQKGLDFRPSLTTNDAHEYDLKFYKIQVLAPSNYLASKGPGSKDHHGRIITTNSISAVVRVIGENDEPILLLPGDLDDIGLYDLLENQEISTTPILLFPHHGGLTGSTKIVEKYTQELLSIIKPSTVIFSIGRNNHYNTPRPEIVSIINNCSSDIRIMCTELSEHCAAQLPEETPAHLAGIRSQGYEFKKCCAGTIIIESSLSSPIQPLIEHHMRFITDCAPTALCVRHN